MLNHRLAGEKLLVAFGYVWAAEWLPACFDEFFDGGVESLDVVGTGGGVVGDGVHRGLSRDARNRDEQGLGMVFTGEGGFEEEINVEGDVGRFVWFNSIDDNTGRLLAVRFGGKGDTVQNLVACVG